MSAALYEQLRAVARSRMAGQQAGHTLQPTALANEALAKILGSKAATIRDEAHFLALAAEAVRQVIVDHARRKSAQKRGGPLRARVGDVDASPAPTFSPDLTLDLDLALSRLEAEDPDLATIVKLRTFSGLTTEEIGALLGVTRKTVERRWRYAAAVLRDQLAGWGPTESPRQGSADPAQD